jgi:HEAT repeat protein
MGNSVNRIGMKLNDEQIRRFICDGVLVLDSGVAPAIHEAIYEKIQWNNTREFNMGNNVLPRVPELQHILDAPVIHGAMQSVLGDDYILHPHRFMHASEPLAIEDCDLLLKGDEHGTPMGEGSSGASVWHQDGQCPLARARYHVPRIAMVLYFPQDTPFERGPTRVIPGTQLQAGLYEEDYPFAFVPGAIKAGTCLLIAFDIAHAALSNRTDVSRYMFKFVFLRSRNPIAPSWAGSDVDWQPPSQRLGRFEHDRAWSYIWNWMRGASTDSTIDPDPVQDIPTLIASLNEHDQATRLDAIYTLAAIGIDAIQPLCTSLLSHAGLQREFGLRYHEDEKGSFIPDGDPHERRWSEIAIAMQDEAYALGAMGEIAVQPLVELLKHDDAWIQINVAFALGEIGAPASIAMPQLTQLLDHKRHQVVRTTLDAIGCIGTDTGVALGAIRKLVTVDNSYWHKTITRGWTSEDQIRFNALYALLNGDIPIAEIEDLLMTCLEDSNGYVPALALEALTRQRDGEERPGLQRALSFLKAHRFDDSLAEGQRVF